MPEKTHYEGPRFLNRSANERSRLQNRIVNSRCCPTRTSGPTNGRRYGGPVWEWSDHPIGPIDSACLPKRIPETGWIPGSVAAEWRGRNRRKLSCDDYNPAHVESGRLESFPVQGAF